MQDVKFSIVVDSFHINFWNHSFEVQMKTEYSHK